MSTNVFALPDLGEGLTEAELIRWLVSTGDDVAVDTPLAEVETAKATIEVPSPYSGVVAKLHNQEGDTIAVGAPMVSVVDDRHDTELTATATDTSPGQARADSGQVLIGYGAPEPAPSRRRRPRRSSMPPESVADFVPSEPEAESAPSSTRPAVQSPSVRNLARSAGLDLTTVTGTGPNGLITRRDVDEAQARRARPAGTAHPEPPITKSATTDGSATRWSDPAWHEDEAARLGSGESDQQDELNGNLAQAQLHATLAVALRLRRAEEARRQDGR